MKEKVIVIIGPTAVGKSTLGIKLAKKFRGEIISADSRQVYKGMDLGTGKVTKAEQKLVPHHLLDVTTPKRQFTVAHFTKLAKVAIKKIINKNKIPFVVGGTAFYIYSLIDDLKLPEVKPNLKLRKSLEKKSTEELFIILKNLDPRRAKTIDRNNRVRLIRAIEINIVSGKPVPQKKLTLSNHVLLLGIKKDPVKLRELINKRVDERIKVGMINEVKRLKKSGLSFKKLDSFGLEYRFISHHLQGKLSFDDMIRNLKTAIYQFAKRQMTWFKKDQRINWIKSEAEASKLIQAFLKK